MNNSRGQELLLSLDTKRASGPQGKINSKMFKGGTMDMFRSEEMQLMQVRTTYLIVTTCNTFLSSACETLIAFLLCS